MDLRLVVDSLLSGGDAVPQESITILICFHPAICSDFAAL